MVKDGDEDYDRRNCADRKVAFGEAFAALCNQWGMVPERTWLAMRAAMDGEKVEANPTLDDDGDVAWGISCDR